MATARDLIKHKGESPQILTISPDASAFKAMELMAEHNVGALLVEGTDGNIEGIVSERDFLRKLDVQGHAAKETHVRDIMTGKVFYVECTQPIEACMALMNEKGIRHLPVYEDEKLIGLISIRDVLREIIAEQKSMISHLEHYIRGGAQ
jgi:CBS domain-containing protein